MLTYFFYRKSNKEHKTLFAVQEHGKRNISTKILK